ncbi:AAA family ATPase [Pendulispora rubella]|uniref:AAA family ATPase n=1 Tax=Pendulispora rubella TaxID=2741070 RepID=A0ABZ2KWD1_9BACT
MREGVAFIGRAVVVAELVTLLDRVAEGIGGLALVAGEPGIGKTALLERLATAASAEDVRILWGACWEADGQPPYWPLVQMLRRIIADVGWARVEHSVGEDAPWLGPLLPEGSRAMPPTASSGEQARFRLFDTFTRLLADIARERPILLVVDDLHWADEGTLRYLEFVGRQLRDFRVLVACTYRDIPTEQSPALRRHLPSLTRLGRRIDLEGMPADEIGALMHAVTGRVPDAALVAEVHERSGGNPLFAGEVARAGLAERRFAAADAVPSGVSHVVTSRLARLPAATVTLLQQAAVLGNAFELPTLAQMAGCSIQATREALHEAVRGRIIAEKDDGGRMAFIHALVRDTLYEQLPRAEVARLHRRAADALVVCGPGTDGASAARLSHHFALGGSVDRAMAYATMAGEHALHSLAYEDAAQHFQNALNLEGALGGDEARRLDMRCRLLLQLGHAQWRSGDGQLASTTYAKALEIARLTRDAEAFALAALGCCARAQLWVFDRELVRELEQALLGLGESDSPIRAQVLARLAKMLYLDPASISHRADLASRAIEVARRVDDPVTLIEALSARPLDTTEDRLTTANEVFHLASRMGDEELVMESQFSRAMAMLEGGDRNGAELVIGSYGVMADKRRVPLWQFHHRCLVACLARMSGRFDEAQARLEEAADLGARAKLPGAGVICEHHLAHLALDRGQRAAAEASVQSLAAYLARQPLIPDYINCILTRLQIALGSETEARVGLDRFLVTGERPRVAGPVGAVSLMLLAEMVHATGARDYAASLFEELKPYEGCVAVSARFVYCAGPVSYTLGLLAAMLDRHDDAERYFDIAREIAARMGASAWSSKIREQSSRWRRQRAGLQASHSPERVLARLGSVIQLYRIERVLGVGGMAAVYAARAEDGHPVAMKVMLERFLDDPALLALFAREALIANQVGHPGAVPILAHDVDEDGCPFLIMPLLEGETLRRRWERADKHLSMAEVGVLLLDVLDVLSAAHEKGIVHRDIKPENVFVTLDGDARVLDFGIARRVDGEGSVTVTGQMFGTPAFMPPEQALGDRRSIGPHSDCWAVGATIFTLISGEFVHAADNVGAQLAAAATKSARSLREVAPNLPASMVRFVDRALAFEPTHRWPSATPMRTALAEALCEALGRPLDEVTTQVRTNLRAELSPDVDETRANALRASAS